MEQKREKKRFKYSLIILIIRFFVFTIPRIPRKLILPVFAFFGHLAYLLLKKERQKTIKNLMIAFGDKYPEMKLRRMARMVFVNQSKNLCDYVHAIRVKDRKAFSKYAVISGEENLKEAYEKGKGVICLICHTGSWEFSAITPSILGYRTTAVSKALKNPRLNKLIKSFRESRGLNNLNRGDTYPALLESLNNGECLIIMIDQDTRVKSIFVDFLGKPAYTPIGAAMLALDTEASVVPMAMRRLENGKHEFKIKKVIPTIRTEDRNSDIIENTRNYSKVIEEYIMEYPEQWVWMHKRWKTQPEDVKELIKQGLIKDTRLLQKTGHFSESELHSLSGDIKA